MAVGARLGGRVDGAGLGAPAHPPSRISIQDHNTLCRLVCVGAGERSSPRHIGRGLCGMLQAYCGEQPQGEVHILPLLGSPKNHSWRVYSSTPCTY